MEFMTPMARSLIVRGLLKSKTVYSSLVFLDCGKVDKLEKLNTEMLHMCFKLMKSTNKNYLYSLLNWYPLEEELLVKMISQYQKIKNLRSDHYIHEFANGKNLIEFWSDYNKNTKKIMEKMSYLIPEKIIELPKNILKATMKNILFEERNKIRENETRTGKEWKALVKDRRRFEWLKRLVKTTEVDKMSKFLSVLLRQSNFNVDLHYRGLCGLKKCRCGELETSIHVLFVCPLRKVLGEDLRRKMKNRIEQIKIPMNIVEKCESFEELKEIMELIIKFLKGIRK